VSSTGSPVELNLWSTLMGCTAGVGAGSAVWQLWEAARGVSSWLLGWRPSQGSTGDIKAARTGVRLCSGLG